jgi:hypothetical protein
MLTSIYHSKFFRIRAPSEIMDGTLLVQCDSTVKVPGSAEEVHASLPVVTFVRVIDFSLRQDQNLRSERIPLDLSTISLKEGLLAGWGSAEC